MVYPINTSTNLGRIEPGFRRIFQLMLALSLLASGARAADDKKDVELEEQQRNLPNLELLEFLGSFETDSGEWISPTELIQNEFELLLKDVESQKGKQPISNGENDTKRESLKDEN